MTPDTWMVFVSSLFDWDGRKSIKTPGADLMEWFYLFHYDYDEIDREHYLDTIGG